MQNAKTTFQNKIQVIKNVNKVKSVNNSKNNQKRAKEKGFWKKHENQKEYLDVLFTKLSLKSMEDWKKVTSKQIRENGGGGILNHFNFNLQSILEKVYKNYSWNFHPKREIKPKGYWKNIDNQKHFFNNLSKNNKGKITTKLIIENGGGSLLRQCRGNFINFLSSLYSCDEINHHKNEIDNFADDNENKNINLNDENNNNNNELNSNINFKEIDNVNDNFENINNKQNNNFIQEENKNNNKNENNNDNDKKILLLINNQRIKIKKKKEKGHWNNHQNCVHFMDNLFYKFNFNSLNDWKKISTEKFIKNGGKVLITKYSNLRSILKNIYPFFPWNFEENSKKSERGFWLSFDHQINFMEKKIYDHFQFNSFDDFEKLKKKKIIQQKGRGLLAHFNEDLKNLLISLYPNYPWTLSGTNQKKGNGFWNKIENQIFFFTKLKEKLKLTTEEDWLFVRTKDIIHHGGISILKIYSFDLPRMFSTIFPQFSHIFDHFYQLKNIRLKQKVLFYQKYFDVKEKKDWFRISGEELFKSIGGLFHAISEVHPDQRWSKFQFINRSKKSRQHWLILCLKKIYPQFISMEDYKHPRLSSRLGVRLELDSFIPSLNLGFEYQGEQHYDDIPSAFSTLELYQKRDIEKIDLCNLHSIRLIVIPFWWDKSTNSLSSTINESFDRMTSALNAN